MPTELEVHTAALLLKYNGHTAKGDHGDVTVGSWCDEINLEAGRCFLDMEVEAMATWAVPQQWSKGMGGRSFNTSLFRDWLNMSHKNLEFNLVTRTLEVIGHRGVTQDQVKYVCWVGVRGGLRGCAGWHVVSK